jgi:hypothetical protein
MYYEDKTLQRFVAIDSTSKLAYAERHSSGTKPVAARFLRHLIDATPDTIRTGLRDHGIESTRDAHHIDAFRHIFDRVCQAHAIKHGSTKVNQPWTNERVTRMNRTIKDATVNHYHD